MMGGYQQWFAVRCCCTPRKVFGFLKLPAVQSGNTRDERIVVDTWGQEHTIKLMPISINKRSMSDECRRFIAVVPFDLVEDIGLPEVAIYSDDRPIEFWRTIEGFMEATTQEEDHG